MKLSSLFLSAMGLFSLFSCQSGNTGESTVIQPAPEVKSFKNARLVQVDSIMIDVIGNFKVYDYQPESELFLGGDIKVGGIIVMGAAPKSNELGHMVINRKGEVIHQFNHTDKGPEGHGSGAIDNFFTSPNSIGVFSSKALFQYHIDGSFLGKHPEINTQDQLSMSNHRVGFSSDGKHIAMGMAKGMEESKKAWDSLYQKGTALWFYNFDKPENSLSTENFQKALLGSDGFPDHPIYAPTSKFPHSPFPPRMALNHNRQELLSVYPEIPEITVYDMLTGAMTESYPLDPDYFEFETEEGKATGGIKGYEGLLWLNRGGRMANSKYHDIIQLGDYTLLRYSTALPSDAVNQLITTGGPGKSDLWPSFRRKHYRFYYQLFKGSEKMLPDFELPLFEPKMGDTGFKNNSMTKGKIIGGNGLDEIFVFIPNDGEEERDYELIRVFKLDLLEE
ncbi:MAG: hypothetical protein HEP71_12440 [Roseivirga sp.]|nr:hypothetical protein [Roseivirga sp.]